MLTRLRGPTNPPAHPCHVRTCSDWEDNANLDKALMILQSVKNLYPGISWGDLIVLAGTTAIENMVSPPCTSTGRCGSRRHTGP